MITFRWVLMLPAAIGAGWLSYFLVKVVAILGTLLFTGESATGMPDLLADITSHIAMGFVATYVGVRVAPSYPRQVALGFSGLILLLAGAAIYASFVLGRWQHMLDSVGMIAGSLAYTASVLTKKESLGHEMKVSMKHLKDWLSALLVILLIGIMYSVWFVDTWATLKSWYYWIAGPPKPAAEVSLVEVDAKNPQHVMLVTALARALSAGGLDPGTARVAIVQSQEINAAALGNDTFILFEGVANLPDWATEAIMAHEVGHALKEHPTKAGRTAGITGLVARRVAALFGASREGIEEYGELAERAVLPQYTQAQELEADMVAVEILRNMGYGETAPAMLAETLRILKQKYGDLGGGFFDSHPALSARIEALTAYAQTGEHEFEEFKNEPSGFRGIKWGTPLSEFDDLIIREEKLPIKVRWVMANRRKEDLKFEGVNVSSINYFFENNVLSSVTLMVYSEQDFRKLKEFCFTTYGKGKMSAHSQWWKRRYNYPKYEKYRWEGKLTIVELTYKPDYRGSYYGQLAYSSIAHSPVTRRWSR